jgi:hypothetical protein
MESSYLLLVHSPDDAVDVFARLESRRPWSRIAPGELLRVRGLRLRVCGVEEDVVDGRLVRRAYTARDNVVVMPCSPLSPIADLYRYHAFVERFGCDADAWLEHLRARGRGDSGDARLARSLRTRMRRDPNLVDAIRRLVAATPMDDDGQLKKRTS